MKAVVLAGGKGTRLAPYTTVFPKPLVPVCEMPILEVVIRQLKVFGFSEVILAVGHLAELIEAYFGSGEKFGIPISYMKEEFPLGTAGPLALVPKLHESFLVMNGDILTSLDFIELMNFHKSSKKVATIGMHSRNVNVDFGVLSVNQEREIEHYDEKPVLNYQVSMGIYAFEPEILKYISPGIYMDFPDLIKVLLERGEKINGFPFNGYWLDIGRPDDYTRAVNEFSQLRRFFHIDEVDHSVGRSRSVRRRNKRG